MMSIESCLFLVLSWPETTRCVTTFDGRESIVLDFVPPTLASESHEPARIVCRPIAGLLPTWSGMADDGYCAECACYGHKSEDHNAPVPYSMVDVGFTLAAVEELREAHGLIADAYKNILGDRYTDMDHYYGAYPENDCND